MVRFYCPYCKTYLTHDTASVRRSHLLGKNHIRLVADYYKNVSQVECLKQRRRKDGKRRTQRFDRGAEQMNNTRNLPKQTIHCLTNKKKRRSLRLKGKDTGPELDVLSLIYQGSPGYERIFKPELRIDVGHMLKVSKQPQRGNVYSASASTPNSTAAATFLPPPRTLTWNNTYTMKYHDPSLLQKSVQHTVKQLKR